MVLKQGHIEKLYYSISEVAKMFEVNPSLIRFWEKEFDIIQPKKNKKGNRMFTKMDIDNFKLIFQLVKNEGYTLDGAKQKLKKSFANVRQNHEIYTKLQNLREKLVALKSDL